MLWQVDVPHACYGVVTERGVVVETAPIGRWLLGMSVEQAKAWAESKGGSLKPCGGGKHQPSPGSRHAGQRERTTQRREALRRSDAQ